MTSDPTISESHDHTPKMAPEELRLRARPRPVTRISRRVMFITFSVALGLISGAVMLALDPPNFKGDSQVGRELYRTENNPRPAGFESLPRRYSDLPKAAEKSTPSIELGPPLPGDLGGAVLSVEENLGLAVRSPQPFRPNAEDDAKRAERIRRARQAQQARESGIFISLSGGDRVSASAGAMLKEDVSNEALHSFPYGEKAYDSLNQNHGGGQSLPGHKADFLNRDTGTRIYNPHRLQEPVSPYQLMAGSIIAGSLITGIHSDLPGHVIAQVTANVYDTVTGQYLLIPQGSRLIGDYDSVVAFGQERALVVWQRIIMPDGSSIMIDNLPGSDAAGYAGLKDKVNFHSGQLMKGIALSTLLGVSTELTLGNNESNLVAALRDATQGSANQAGQKIAERHLNIQPTITIRPGWPVRIIVHKDLILRPYHD